MNRLADLVAELQGERAEELARSVEMEETIRCAAILAQRAAAARCTSTKAVLITAMLDVLAPAAAGDRRVATVQTPTLTTIPTLRIHNVQC